MSILDIVTTPIYTETIPSTKLQITYRPFLVIEEKALLAAQESEDMLTMLNTITSVVKACVSPASATDYLTSFDVEFLFVKIRMKSIGEESLIQITCPTCETVTPIAIPLDKMIVYIDPENKSTIKLSDSLAVTMRFPSIDEMTSITVNEDSEDTKMKMIALSIKTAFDGDNQYHAKDETPETMLKFVKKFTSVQYDKLAQFFDTMPETRLTFDWTCPNCRTHHDKTLRGLNNFF
jgi:hypothetical protein